jgi:nitrate reductase assembly molybdenum cofactor insertion protein NarJ
VLDFRHRRRFADVVERQLDLFEREQAGLIRDCEAALRAYTDAESDEAEERYGDFVDLVDTGRDELVSLRDTYAQTLDEDAAEEYAYVFNTRVRKRLPRFGLELD